MINGLSSGKTKAGYRHPIKYWKSSGALESETISNFFVASNSDFYLKFGAVYYEYSSGKLTYSPNSSKEGYFFPDQISEYEIEQLMERSVKENKDLIIDLVKDNPVVYKPGCLY